jgi:hypothetical protein
LIANARDGWTLSPKIPTVVTSEKDYGELISDLKTYEPAGKKM